MARLSVGAEPPTASPITGIDVCCAKARCGDIAAAPKRPMNSRRLILPPTSRLDHHVVVLDTDPERLGDVGALDQPGALLHRDAEAARLDLVGIAPGLAGADVELPGVPGAAD